MNRAPAGGVADALTPHRVGRCLACAACGRVIPCGDDEIDRYAGDGWPRCCGEVMSLGEADWDAGLPLFAWVGR